MEDTGVAIMVGEVEVDGTGHLDLVEDTAEATAPEAEVARMLIGGIKFMFLWAHGVCQ